MIATANLIPEVAAASDETLVSALIVLTHQTHGANADTGKSKDRIRYERDLVRTEILRRMGEAR
jgi:hypothetical protein